MLKGEMSEIGEFTSGVSKCRSKNPKSDLGTPFCPPPPGGTGVSSSGSVDE